MSDVRDSLKILAEEGFIDISPDYEWIECFRKTAGQAASKGSERTYLARLFLGLPDIETNHFSRVGMRVIADSNACISSRPSLTPLLYSASTSTTSGCPPFHRIVSA